MDTLRADTREDIFTYLCFFLIHLSFTHIQASDVHSITCTSAARLIQFIQYEQVLFAQFAQSVFEHYSSSTLWDLKPAS